MKIRGRGRGSKLLRDFFDELGGRFNKKMNAYFLHSSRQDKKNFDYAFWYHEQTSKGFITACIDEITESNFLQEFSVERNKRKRGRKGRVDYRVRYEASIGIDMLVEVKQAWTSIKCNKLKLRDSITTRLEQCYKQVKGIKHPTWCSHDNVYGVAMVIVPIYAPDKSNDKSKFAEIIKSDDTKQAICDKTGAEHVLAYATPDEYLRAYKEDNRESEYYIPGFFTIFKTKKLSRDRI